MWDQFEPHSVFKVDHHHHLVVYLDNRMHTKQQVRIFSIILITLFFKFDVKWYISDCLDKIVTKFRFVTFYFFGNTWGDSNINNFCIFSQVVSLYSPDHFPSFKHLIIDIFSISSNELTIFSNLVLHFSLVFNICDHDCFWSHNFYKL